jgi:hypothetical protein
MALGLTERGEIEQRLGADLSENTLEDGYEGASARLDRALGRLEASMRSLNARMRAQARIDVDTQKLVVERARLAADLDKASAKARRLDDSAHEVSVRLVEAMETVRAVLTK